MPETSSNFHLSASLRLILWFCRVALRIAAENMKAPHWQRIFQNPISCGMFREIEELGKDIDLALWPNGQPPKVYKD
jgi:hypothetical protein